MATELSLYGVTGAIVKKYLPQVTADGNTTPNIDEIDSGGEFLSAAAADVQDALLEGGFGASPTATTESNVIAYWQLHRAIATRAAAMFAAAQTHGSPDDKTEKTIATSDKLLMEWRSAKRIGELTSATGSSVGLFFTGDDDIDDLLAERASNDDPL